uniref:Acetylglutamate kinase n=1 Tax=Balbiania investiens TaxID=111861 RepID=A0A4D6BKS7_9FLOR|nr:acetylglutamate kinase [Balbiania investiens]QBX88586.1 acetylglutamate kinase [Balbiania investiens]
MMNYSNKIELLSTLLPSIQRIKGSIIVIKYGGAAMIHDYLTDAVVQDITLLCSLGAKVILVHGGGPEINKWLAKFSIEPKFNNGIRITDPQTMEIVEMVLSGKVNKELVSLINKNNGSAIGLSGKDGNFIIAEPLEPNSNSLVGCVKSIDINLISLLSYHNYIPIISPIASDCLGQSYNINADTVAGEIAGALQASRFVLLTNTPGILTDIKDPATLLSSITVDKISHLVSNGTIFGGMLPKINCCIDALRKGVNSTHIIDGRIPHCLLLDILTSQSVGTTITL